MVKSDFLTCGVGMARLALVVLALVFLGSVQADENEHTVSERSYCHTTCPMLFAIGGMLCAVSPIESCPVVWQFSAILKKPFHDPLPFSISCDSVFSCVFGSIYIHTAAASIKRMNPLSCGSIKLALTTIRMRRIRITSSRSASQLTLMGSPRCGKGGSGKFLKATTLCIVV